ncbi:unnamed protein product, partial [Closterium sp. NIES-53]
MWPTDTRHVSNDYSHPFPSPSFRRPSSLPLSYSAVAVQIPVPLPPPLLPIPPFILFPTQQYRAPHRPTAAPPLGAMAAARPSCRLRAAVGVKVPSAALLSDHPPSPASLQQFSWDLLPSAADPLAATAAATASPFASISAAFTPRTAHHPNSEDAADAADAARGL